MDEAFGDELEQAFTDWDAEQDAGQDDLEANKCNNDDAEANALERTTQATQPPTEGSVAAAAAPASTPDTRPRLHLLQLPREMLLRVMSLLPATGLTAAACTCRLLSELASEDAVWRRLYLCRWGKPEQHVRANGKQWKRTYLDADGEEWEATRRQHQDLDLDLTPAPKSKPKSTHKSTPAAASASPGGAAGPSGGGGSSRAAGRCRGGGGEAAAAATTGSAAGGTPAATPSRGAAASAASAASGAASGAAGASGSAAPGAVSGPCVGLGAMFLDMLRAKRDTAPDRRQLDDRMMGADPGDIAAKVAAWRRARGFEGPGAAGPSGSGASGSAPQQPPRPDLSHRGRAAVTFTRVNPGEEPPVYACEQTGWVHVCGDACTEGVVDARSELLVCPVSGQTTDRLVHECEEDEAGGGGAGGAAGGEEDGLGLGITAGFGRYFTAGYECENAQQLNRLLGYKAL